MQDGAKTDGMSAPSFAIGKYILRNGYEGRHKIFIEAPSGEGGDFPVDKLEELIDKFYAKNF